MSTLLALAVWLGARAFGHAGVKVAAAPPVVPANESSTFVASAVTCATSSTSCAAEFAYIRKAELGEVPGLIVLLLDTDTDIAREAQQKLRRFSGEDFGPFDLASPIERMAAADRRQAWWLLQTGWFSH